MRNYANELCDRTYAWSNSILIGPRPWTHAKVIWKEGLVFNYQQRLITSTFQSVEFDSIRAQNIQITKEITQL